MRQEQVKHRELLYKNISHLPWYVQEYFDYKEDSASPSTLFGYAHEYIRFFQWLMSESLVEQKIMQDIPYSALAELRRKDIDNYIKFLHRRGKLNSEKEEIQKQPLKKATVRRSISALKALFHYLTAITEDEETGEPYFYRNVMAKIEITKERETINARAKKMRAKILHGDDDRRLLEFVAGDYRQLVAETKKETYYLRDRERDIAILSLFLGSGVRVGELADLRLDGINEKERMISIVRKGGKEDAIWMTPTALEDLKGYLAVRQEKYPAAADTPYVFLAWGQGECRPMGVRAIQKMVAKYTQAFNMRLTPHKLRHTFATNFYNQEGDALQVMMQLGHSSTNTTVLYTQLADDTLKRSLARLDDE